MLAEDAARVCRDTGAPLALVTDGQLWVLAHAVPGGPTSLATFDADLWQEEPVLLRAFATLLGSTRVLPAPRGTDGTPTASLAALFARTADAQAQITTTLGEQVRRAVELFVGELARLDRESGGALLAEVGDRDLYRGSLTTLMRLVFLLYAEQRELLPVGDPVYAEGYAVTTLYRQLTEDRDRYGDEVGDRRSAAWPRLLATFAAVHGGCEHPDLRIPDPGARRLALPLKHRSKAAGRLSYMGLRVEQRIGFANIRDMTTWEYRVETVNISERWSSKRQREEIDAFRRYLNEAGAEGWEMISYESVPMTGNFTDRIKGYAYLTFFKRPRVGEPH